MAAVITCIQHAEAAGKSNVDEMVFRYQDCIAQAGNVSAVPFFNIAHVPSSNTCHCLLIATQLYSTVEQHDLALQNLMVALRVLYAEHNVGSPKDVANIPSDRIRQKFFDVFNNMAHSYLALNALGDARDSFQAVCYLCYARSCHNQLLR